MPSSTGSPPSPVVITQVEITLCPRLLATFTAPAAHPVASSIKRTQNRGAKYYTAKLVNLFKTMKEILPIEPDEWKKVVDLHLVEFPGRAVDSLRRKYTSIHQKKVTTRDPNMPEEVRSAKKIKYMIVD